MFILRIFLLSSAAAAIRFAPEHQNTTEQAGPGTNTTGILTRAASSFVNCGCQCSSLTFRDEQGKVHGNCKSVDAKGAQWCYISSTHYSSCEDLVPSTKFPNNPWSYSACATPDLSSYECLGLASTPTDTTVCAEGQCITGYSGFSCPPCPSCSQSSSNTRPLTIADIITGKAEGEANEKEEEEADDSIIFRK
jgi:hypothetical protein